MARRLSKSKPTYDQRGTGQTDVEIYALEKAQMSLQVPLDQNLISRFQESLNFNVNQSRSSPQPSPQNSADTARTKGVPLRVGKEFSADSTFQSIPQNRSNSDGVAFISLPLPPEVSRVEHLYQLCVNAIATTMAQWTTEVLAQHHRYLNQKSISMLPTQLKELLLKTLTCRLALTDYSLRPLLFPTLINLDLSHCAAITDASLAMIRVTCPELERISLCNCHKLTEAAVLQFLAEAPALVAVDLEGLLGKKISFEKAGQVGNSRRPPLLWEHTRERYTKRNQKQ